ncbi:hypothetical protein [Geomicrobium sediminis]|uniref:Uncharacterized protein n=1 Tax=Geomicrobium sediminis TaxID=1347788 RepID=A0ABS2P6R3_9BACL|nr:hypothetical protein [Geomicrobium sediminis]MBM7631087.1 hypothetical protein [Geomicrobium sediminis]
MFDQNSIVARTWAEVVYKGDRSIEEVPSLFNLVDVVTHMVNEDKGGENNV